MKFYLEQNTPKINSNQSRVNLKWVESLRQKKTINTNNNNNSYNDLSNSKDKSKIESMIENAKIHREANRPLFKIKEFDGFTKFCKCCYLPAKDDIYLKNFSCCENTDKFAECGRGITLYYFYFRFSIIILLFALISMALPTFLISNNYTNELSNICYEIYSYEKEKINITFPDCINFINVKGVSEIFIKDTDWESRFSAKNLKDYRTIYKLITNNTSNNIDKIIINYNIVYFIGLSTLFIINSLNNILLHNINKQYDISVTSPSDYTVIISNLYSAFNIFWKKIKKINNQIKKINKINLTNHNETYKSTKNNKNSLKMKEIEELGLEDMPKNEEINILDAFHKFIKNKICISSNGDKYNICQINICYKISEFMKLEDEIQKYNRKLYIVNHAPYQIEKNEKLNLQNNDRKYFYYPMDILGFNMCTCFKCEKYQLVSDIEKNKNKLESKLKELLKQTENLTKDNFAGVIFVTFDSINETEKFLELYPKNIIMKLLVSIKDLKYFLCYCCVKKNKLKIFLLKKNISVDVAPEPEDVIFENLQYSSCERFLRMLLIYFISFIIIAICFFIILFLNYLQIKHKEKHSENKLVIKYILSLAIALVISVLNAIFQSLLNTLTKKEKQISMTNYYLSFSIKLTIFTFTTSGILPLISCFYFSKSNYYLLESNMLTLFLSNSFLTPIMWSMNFQLLLKEIKIYLVEKKCIHYTQKELNNLYELLDMEIAYKYSYITKTLLMSFLYMPIFPLGIFISLIGFIFGYFIEKFNFSKMYKRPEVLNSKICEFYTNYYILTFFMLAVGDFVFLRDTYKSNTWLFLNIILFGVLIIIPYNQIFGLDLIGINESEIKGNLTFEDAYFNFYNDYERTNPMTKKEGIKHFFMKLVDNGLITKQNYEEIINNFENINLMETYYKARKNFNNSLIQKAFLSLGGNNNPENKKKSTFIENMKRLSQTNNKKPMNLLFFLGNHKNVEDNNANNNYNEREGNENTYKDNGNEYKNDESRVIDNNEGQNLNFERTKIKRRSKKLLKNYVKKEEIYNLYNNPLFFGVTMLCNTVILNKDKKNEEIKANEVDNDGNDTEIIKNDMIKSKSIKKKKKRKKKKNKKNKKKKLDLNPIIIYKTENINNDNINNKFFD